jgi:hypothetical protein
MHEIKGFVDKAVDAAKKEIHSEIQAGKAAADELRSIVSDHVDNVGLDADAAKLGLTVYTQNGIQQASNVPLDFEHLFLAPKDEAVADMLAAGKTFEDITNEALQNLHKVQSEIPQDVKDWVNFHDEEGQKIIEKIETQIITQPVTPVVHVSGPSIDFSGLAGAITGQAQALVNAFLKAFEELLKIKPEEQARAIYEIQKELAKLIMAEVEARRKAIYKE